MFYNKKKALQDCERSINELEEKIESLVSNGKTMESREAQEKQEIDLIPQLDCYINILQLEYSQIKSFKDPLETKAITLLTIIVAMITVYVPIYPFAELGEFFKNPSSCQIWDYVMICVNLGIGAVVLSIYCCATLLQVYATKRHSVLSCQKLSPYRITGDYMDLMYNNQVQYKNQVISDYQHTILAIRNEISSDGTKLKHLFVLTFVIFLMLSLSAIGTIIFTGWDADLIFRIGGLY